MLKILGPASRGETFCDGLSRRNFLQVGSLGVGLTLADLLAAEAKSPTPKPARSVILIYLVGGPPHQDMFDLKPRAPKEVRGEFNPIPTNVPGIEIGEHLPGLAKMMDKFTIIRSICDAQSGHNAFQSFTGRNQQQPMPPGDWPTLGATVSRLQGPLHRSVPPYVSLCYTCTHGPYNDPVSSAFPTRPSVHWAPVGKTWSSTASPTTGSMTVPHLDVAWIGSVAQLTAAA